MRLPDGRELAYCERGDPDGVPVVWHHGSPGSRLERHPDEAVHRDAGVRLLTFDRPGYGRSSALPGRRVVDVAADVQALADHLGLDSERRRASGAGPRGSLQPEVGRLWVEKDREAVRQGDAVWFDDDLALDGAWGFDLAAIDVPVRLWQGELDVLVPRSHGDYLARKIPGSSLELVPDAGHLLVDHMPAAFRWLVDGV